MQIKKWLNSDVTMININNELGLDVTLCSFGASIYDLKTADKNGKMESVVLYPTNLKDFYYNDGYHGKTVGRFSGRIDKAKCEINGVSYRLDYNWNGVNSLHGGHDGISFSNFNYELQETFDYLNVTFSYLEKENKLPGDVYYEITYQISKCTNTINLLFKAKATKDTIINLTNHVYFNLSGDLKKTILDQDLYLACDKYTKLNNELITESIEPVNAVMDFRVKHPIGQYIYDDSLQKHKALGYDHCFIKADNNTDLIAKLSDCDSGRILEVRTSYPAIVCYAGCYPKEFLFNGDKLIKQYHSLCLECQYIPNGINMNQVEKAILKAGDLYSEFIRYDFKVE